MKYYAYVGHKGGVYTDWRTVYNLMAQYPFSSVRKFYSEQKAWDYVRSHETKSYFKIQKVGFTYSEHAAIVEYFIDYDATYINILFPEDYVISVYSTPRLEVHKTTENVYMLKINKALDFYSARDHVFIASTIIEFIGPIMDININVYDDTLYYVSRYYNGQDSLYKDFIEALETRIGEVAYVYGRYADTEVTKSDINAWRYTRIQQEERSAGGESSNCRFEEV